MIKMQTNETKSKIMNYISIAAASVAVVTGLEGCMSAYQPKVASGVIEYLDSDQEKQDSVQLNSEREARISLYWIIGAECEGEYFKPNAIGKWALIASDKIKCMDYICIKEENCGRDSGSDCHRTYDWRERWNLDLDDIQLMYTKSGWGTNIEIITTKGEKKNINFNSSRFGEKAADIIYTFFCKGCNK